MKAATRLKTWHGGSPYGVDEYKYEVLKYHLFIPMIADRYSGVSGGYHFSASVLDLATACSKTRVPIPNSHVYSVPTPNSQLSFHSSSMNAKHQSDPGQILVSLFCMSRTSQSFPFMP